jgi:hypothetical protein
VPYQANYRYEIPKSSTWFSRSGYARLKNLDSWNSLLMRTPTGDISDVSPLLVPGEYFLFVGETGSVALYGPSGAVLLRRSAAGTWERHVLTENGQALHWGPSIINAAGQILAKPSPEHYVTFSPSGFGSAGTQRPLRVQSGGDGLQILRVFPSGFLLGQGTFGGSLRQLIMVPTPDSDEDGLSDAFESNANGWNLNPGEDFDGDGLLEEKEFAIATNPFTSDSDNDTISDRDELLHAMNPLDPQDALEDWDLDRLTNAQELAIGLGIMGTFRSEVGGHLPAYYEGPVPAVLQDQVPAPIYGYRLLAATPAGDLLVAADTEPFWNTSLIRRGVAASQAPPPGSEPQPWLDASGWSSDGGFRHEAYGLLDDGTPFGLLRPHLSTPGNAWAGCYWPPAAPSWRYLPNDTNFIPSAGSYLFYTTWQNPIEIGIFDPLTAFLQPAHLPIWSISGDTCGGHVSPNGHVVLQGYLNGIYSTALGHVSQPSSWQVQATPAEPEYGWFYESVRINRTGVYANFHLKGQGYELRDSTGRSLHPSNLGPTVDTPSIQGYNDAGQALITISGHHTGSFSYGQYLVNRG